MFDKHIHYFRGTRETGALVLPFNMDALLADWEKVRSAMLKHVPEAFSRDEWAYLVAFLTKQELLKTYEDSFGARTDDGSQPMMMVRPRGPVGVWLPNNVSLLGPLMLILLTLSANAIRLKAGSRSEDLTGAFLAFLRTVELDGPLGVYLDRYIRHESFSSDDPRNTEMAAHSSVRIVFGSDEAAKAIHALPHPLDSTGISFSDRRSEAWIELSQCTHEVLRDLIKVFAIYGQAGCTSPSRVILLNAGREEALKVRDNLAALWPKTIRRPSMHVASDNVRAWQLARAAGWESVLVSENRAVLSVGDYDLKTNPNLMEMRLIPAILEEAVAHLPNNIQTIGHALRDANNRKWLEAISATGAARFVPLRTMHHFETLWDGSDFWAQLFTYTRVRA